MKLALLEYHPLPSETKTYVRVWKEQLSDDHVQGRIYQLWSVQNVLAKLVAYCLLVDREMILATSFFVHKLSTGKAIPSCILPLFQDESRFETIQMEISLICMKMNMRVKLNFTWKVVHQDPVVQRTIKLIQD